MPPQRRPQYTPESIDHQLQQIHLLDPSSSSENLEQLGPIIKQIYANRQQDAYLRNLQALIEAKDSEIESICTENYQEFISSVSTLFTVKSYATSLRDKITTLDESVGHVGKGLVEKKRALLQSKKTAAHLDEAIDTLQACLKLLDVIDRIGDMIREGKFWSALRSLEDIQATPLNTLSQTPLYQHILSSLPSLRTQVQNAVTASMKQWLLEIRNVTGAVGKAAMESMEARTRKWRTRREKDPMLRMSRVGSAVEMVTYERSDNNILNCDAVKVDFQPLYQSIHIYMSLDSLDELRYSYQADRKAQELWDAVVVRLSSAIHNVLEDEKDADTLLKVKECLSGFVATLESYSYSTQALHTLMLTLFERYIRLLTAQSSQQLDAIVLKDDFLPMQVSDASGLSSVLGVVWLTHSEYEALAKRTPPVYLPWSQSFYLCCQDVRTFVQKFSYFVEGVSQHHGNIDECLSRSLDKLLSDHICDSIGKRLGRTSALSQLAQIVTNMEYFEMACFELGRSLTNLRTTQDAGAMWPVSSPFSELFPKARNRITDLITSKLKDFFELSEYEWTPRTREETPSMYLYELVNWLTTVVDSLVIKETYKDNAYKDAVDYIAECLMNFMIGSSVPAMNENALANIMTDITFLQGEFTRIGRGHLSSTFQELHFMAELVLEDRVLEYLRSGVRQAPNGNIKLRQLQALIEKLARCTASRRDQTSKESTEKRKREIEAIRDLLK
ncbi:hypothetical protein ID866_1851 [Astraeus odoratus]|nr:hypothetical protein ID866_1851 [Astraeus odoratus]